MSVIRLRLEAQAHELVKTLWQLYRLKRNVRKSKSEMKVLQERKLRQMLRHAYKHSAYCRRGFQALGIGRKIWIQCLCPVST